MIPAMGSLITIRFRKKGLFWVVIIITFRFFYDIRDRALARAADANNLISDAPQQSRIACKRDTHGKSGPTTGVTSGIRGGGGGA